MVILDVRRDPPDAAAIARAAEVLRDGGCVALPTDTVYGIAAALSAPDAVARLASLKGRPHGVPIAVLVASPAQADLVGVLGVAATTLADRHWPGPLTLVVPARAGVAEVVGADDGSVGIRWPDHALVRALADAVGPLATTSANRHGEATPDDAGGVAAQLPALDLVLDGGPCTGVPSTVVDARVDPPRVLRQGSVTVG